MFSYGRLCNNTNAGNRDGRRPPTQVTQPNGSVATQASFTIFDQSSVNYDDHLSTNVTYDGSALTPCSATGHRCRQLNVPVTVVYGNTRTSALRRLMLPMQGDANHEGSAATQKTFAIDKALIDNDDHLSGRTYVYGQCFRAVLRDGQCRQLERFSPSRYGNNTNVGTATATLAMRDANHTGAWLPRRLYDRQGIINERRLLVRLMSPTTVQL